MRVGYPRFVLGAALTLAVAAPGPAMATAAAPKAGTTTARTTTTAARTTTTGTAKASAAAAQPAFKLDVYPSYATAGFATTFKITVTNTSRGTTLHSIQLTPPRGFALARFTRTSPLRRTATILNRTLSVRNITVRAGATMPILVTATPPKARTQCHAAVMRWSTRAFQGTTPTGPQLALRTTGSQTAVTVVCPKFSGCGPGGNGCHTHQPTRVSNYDVSDNATSGGLNETIDVGRELICPGYTNRDKNWYDETLTNASPAPAGTAPFVDTVTYRIDNTTSSGVGFCLGASYDFTSASHAQAPHGTLPNGKPGFVGLLPPCRGGAPPCIANTAQPPDPAVSSGYDTVLTVLIPEIGDPWGGS